MKRTYRPIDYIPLVGLFINQERASKAFGEKLNRRDYQSADEVKMDAVDCYFGMSPLFLAYHLVISTPAIGIGIVYLTKFLEH